MTDTSLLAELNLKSACAGLDSFKSLFLKFSRFSTRCNPEMADVGIKRFENIQKGKHDPRFYCGLELSNGLKALLMSDPTTDKSAASLTVSVGSLNDFEELPGLAHFLEHMLFLGSKKYPDENGYDKFVAEHAGQSNASTDEHKTNFRFDIGPEHLVEGLDRFAQFFLEPLFEESATQREVNAVNSEHEKNIQSDDWRIYQLGKSMTKADHPYNHFSTGNKESLSTIPLSKGINVREQLLNFHNTWYSANIMCLAILGKESLDELESIVLKLFGDIKNKKVNPVIYDHPFGTEELKRKVCMVPVKDIRSLRIIFRVPDILHQYKTRPDCYISHLIGHRGPGSLYSVLRDKGLCDGLKESLCRGGPGFAFFIICFDDLTEKGLDSIDEIITLLFQYIKLLKSDGVQKWIFDELSKLAEISFSFKDKESPYDYVTDMSAAMDDYPFEDILSSAYHIINEWKPELIVDLLSYLRPDNMTVGVISKSFEDKADQIEKWYGTKYSVEPISNELLEKWNEVELSSVLHLPPPNELISENFDLYHLDDDNAPFHPYVIQETALSRVWFKQDDEFNLPKLVVKLDIFSPIASLDPGNSNLTIIFLNLLVDSLNEDTYDAELAGLYWSIGYLHDGIHLELEGFNEKLPVLLEKLISRMVDFKVDPKRFEIVKETYVRDLRNLEMDGPNEQADSLLSDLLIEREWTYEELLDACNVLEVSNLEKFLTDLFARVYLQSLIHGNCNKEKCKQIADIIETPFKSAICLLPQQLLMRRAVEIENGSQFIYEVFNKYHSDSCLFVYFQCSLESARNNAIVDLFAQIIAEPCYRVLRTQEQLGYIVQSQILRVSGVRGLTILVQSEKHPVYLNSRVEEFLDSVKTLLENMSDEEFEVHKKALITNYSEKPKQLRTRSSEYWSEITLAYNFDRVKLEIEELRSLQKKHILNFYEEYVSKCSCNRRKLSVHVVSKVTNPELPKYIENTETRIEDVTVFKNSLGLCPLPKAYMKITPLGTKPKP